MVIEIDISYHTTKYVWRPQPQGGHNESLCLIAKALGNLVFDETDKE